MASSPKFRNRKDANAWPRMSSTFWAVVLLTSLLIIYCAYKHPAAFRIFFTKERRVAMWSAVRRSAEPSTDLRRRSTGTEWICQYSSEDHWLRCPGVPSLSTMQILRGAWAFAGAAVCCFIIFLIHSHLMKEGQLAAGTCEIVTLDRDSSQPRRTIARQTARCACKRGQIAGTTRARPACVDARIVRTRQWCEMMPCLDDEGCDLLVNKSGWTCTQPGGRVKTTTVS